MTTFVDFPGTVTAATLSGSNGIGVTVQTGIPNKIIVSASNVPNSSLQNSAIKINETVISLGTTGSILAADPNASYIVIGNTGSLSNERALTAGTNISFTDGGANSTITVSTTNVPTRTEVTGALSLYSTLTGVSASFTTPAQVSASITGAINGATTKYADVSASYVVIGTTSSLPNERALAAGTGISIADGGANSTITVSTNNIPNSSLANSAIKINETVISLGSTGSISVGGNGTVNTGSAGYIAYYPSNGTTVDDTTAIYTDGTNVGIGTTSPNAKLDVSGNIRSFSNTQFSGLNISNTTNTIAAIFGDSAGNENGILALNKSGVRTVQLFSNGNSYFASGNVGIGATTPSARLQVAGSTTVSSQPNVAAVIGVGITSDLLLGSLNGNAPFVASQGAYPLTLWTNASERVRIDNAGNVGIGETSPGAYGKLEVKGAGYTGISVRSSDSSGAVGVVVANSSNEVRMGSVTNHPLWLLTNGSERVRIDNAGNVGIGTTSPGAKLDVAPPVDNTYDLVATEGAFRIGNSTNRIKMGVALGGAGAGYANIVAQGTNSKLNLGAGSTEANQNTIRITGSNGNVGIGMEPSLNSSLKLSVSGNISADGIVFGSTGGSVTSKTLEDYEEGTFTPTLFQGYGTITYSTQLGYYTKIGKMVYFTVWIAATATGDGNNVGVGGFPFTSQNISVNGLAFLQSYTSAASIYAYFLSNSTSMLLRANLASGITGITYGNNPTIQLVGYYRTAT